MGLDTSHDCWHGPYSAFMRWRKGLASLVTVRRQSYPGIDLSKTEQYGGNETNLADLLDADDPLLMLFCHSDCEGEIAAEDCGPLADALQRLVDRMMPQRALYDSLRPATERFIAGLRKAAAAGEAVDFH